MSIYYETMNDKTHFLALLFCLLFTFSQQGRLNAQQIVWEYEIPLAKKAANVGTFWIENDQLNINVNNYKTDYLMTLHMDGYLESITYLNECGVNSELVPFTNGTLLTSGFNCFYEGNREYDSRVYSKEGKLIKKGPAFGKGSYKYLKVESGYQFIKNPYNYKFEEVTLGSIDWDFNIEESIISTKRMTHPDFGIAPAGGNLCQTKSGYIVTGFDYGEVKSKNRMTPKGGFVSAFDTENKRLMWQYPQSPDGYVLRRFRNNDHLIGLFRMKMGSSRSLLEIIDESGRLLNSFEIRGDKPVDFVVLKDKIIALFRHHITAYTHDGEVIREYQYDSEKRFKQSRIQKINESEYLVLGYTSSFETAVIRRLSFEEATVTTSEEEELPIVKGVQIDEVDEEVISLSLFPNPASIYINFRLNGDLKADAKYIVEIFDMDGKPVFSQEFDQSEIELEISTLPSGQYFYRLFNADRQMDTKIFSGKFIKI